nr:LuxR C-terminal-related transcriptional regulator [Adlercreutzia muris]
MTKREREILPLLAQGRNRKVIAEQLVLSENTVKTHISNLYAKVHVHSQQELIELVRRRMVGSSDREERSED